MTELILHIGSHKTGTTSIQNACSRHLSGRMQPDIAYADVRKKGTRVISTRGRTDEFDARLDIARVDRLLRPGADRTVASSEGFFWLNRRDQICSLADQLRSRFSRIRIVAYLRRQDLLAVSHQKQIAMGMPAAHFYGVAMTPLPQYGPHLQRYFDYATKLGDHWGEAFGLENLGVRIYDRRQLKDGDVVADFFDILGIELPKDQQPDLNTTLGRDQTIVGLKLRELGIQGRTSRKILAHLSNKGRYLPTRADAKAFLDHFAESNGRLESLFSIDGRPFRFDDSFEMYPETNAGDWDNESVSKLLDGVLRSILEPEDGEIDAS